MKKTADFLEEIIRKNGLKSSDYALQKHMYSKYQWSSTTVSNYRKGKTQPNDDQALDIAEELGLEPGIVLAAIHAERAARLKDKRLAKVWEKVATVMEHGTTAALVAIFAITATAFTPMGSKAYAVAKSTDVYIMRMSRGVREWLRRILAGIRYRFTDPLPNRSPA